MAELVNRRRALYFRNGSIEPAAGAEGSPMGLRRFALLIHGYNNDYEEARRRFMAAKLKLRQVGVSPEMRRNIWEFYWPGYVEGMIPRLRRVINRGPATEKIAEPLSAASYSAQVWKARRIGRLLGEYLLALSGPGGEPAEIILIAHSLGCRLALEAIRVLQDHRRWQRTRLPAVLLMAAAVESNMMGYRERFSETVYVPDKIYILHSRRDFVLHRIFPFGQVLAFEGIHPEAVGYRGRPGIWSGSDETMLGHGEYWESSVTTTHLARLFGLATKHELPIFQVLEWRSPDPNALPQHERVADWQEAKILGSRE